jgi:DNA-binding transcriptional LysR family regulator
MIDLNQIAVFVHVIREGSFAAAARRLHLPPTTVSRQVQQLEDRLGVRLLQRSTRKLTLTHAGRAFHERSAPQVEALLQGVREVSDDLQEPAGCVRVAAPADFFDIFPMAWVADFLQAHPAVQLDFVLSDAVADLIDERIDVAFRGGRLPDSSLVARRLATGRLSLAASPVYLAAHGTPHSVQALVDHACILPSQTAGRAVWRLEGPAGDAEVEVTGRLCANTMQARLKAVLAGLGIGLLPDTLMQQNLRAGRLVQVLPGHGQSGGGFHVVYPSRRHIPRAVTAFVEMTLEHLATLQLPADRRGPA